MGQIGFFDIADRYAGLDAKNDPLARIDEVVPWEGFRPRLEAAWRRPDEERKSPAGRKPWEDRKSTRLNSSHLPLTRMPSSA